MSFPRAGYPAPPCASPRADSFSCAALAIAAPASGAPGIRYGIQDDAWLAHGPGTLDERLDSLERLGVDVVRFNLHWDEVEAARGQPDWRPPTPCSRACAPAASRRVVAIVGTPRWANGGAPPNVAPRRGATFAAFAALCGRRATAWVRDWLVWNEPNQRRWLRPATPALYVARICSTRRYARDPRRRIRGARVAGGVTGAAGSERRCVAGRLRSAACARAGARLDAYAHHPYPARPAETAVRGRLRRRCETITMATLSACSREVARAFGRASASG